MPDTPEMKYSLIILPAIISLVSLSHYHCILKAPSNEAVDISNWYFANDGRDRHQGHSPDNPKQSISELNSLTLEPGDTVFLKCGNTWREKLVPLTSGTDGMPIVFTSFGKGSKPMISRSVPANNTDNWTNVDRNLWIYDNAAFTVDVGNLIFNDDSVGIKERSLGNLDTQGDFWYSYSDNTLTIYSIGNPASVYGNIECALGENAIQLWDGQDYLTFDGSAIQTAWRPGISAANNKATNIIVRKCDFEWCGGMESYEGAGYRLGNGIEFFNMTATDILVEKCYFKEIYDAGVTPQFPNTNDSLINFFVNGNLFIDCRYAFEFSWNQNGNSFAESVHFNNNTCYTTTGGFGSGQRWDGNTYTQIIFYDNGGSGSNDIQIKNNIVYVDSTEGQVSKCIAFHFFPLPDWIDIDYNLYYSSQSFEDNHWLGSASGIHHYSLSSWQTASGSPDGNGYNSDPLLINAPTNLRVNPASEAVDKGVSFVEYTTDYDGTAVSNPPNIGAYE